MAKIKNSQSQKPATGKMITYIKVVQGAKMMPRIGQIIEVKARFQRAGQKSHQTSAAIRGPNRTRVVRKQHIAILLCLNKAHGSYDSMEVSG
jgi:hypothetical protein